MPALKAFSCALLVPCYNHAPQLQKYLPKLLESGLPCVVVDDGGDEPDRAILARLEGVKVLRNEINGGKGAAIRTGARFLHEAGYTHFLQIDADGQHDSLMIPTLVNLAKDNPQHLISAHPVFDESVPFSRKFCRKITNFWVAIETRSLSVEDAMCGFRVYPIETFLSICDSEHLGNRMDFDIEILVRYFWRTGKVIFTPTKVVYPTHGYSNFDLLKDNLRISAMHTRLVCESLWRLLPGTGHWSKLPERRGALGFRLMLWLQDATHPKVFRVLLHPVVFFYWLTGKGQRQASAEFLSRIQARRSELAMPELPLHTFAHFLSFTDSILGRINAWSGRSQQRLSFFDEQSRALLKRQDGERGCLLLVSHLGSVDAIRALAQKEDGPQVHAIMHTGNSKIFRSILSDKAADCLDSVIEVTDMGVATAAKLEEKIAAGHWVAIAADRIPLRENRDPSAVIREKFLGHDADFPIGPYVLASLLKCRVLVLFALQEGEAMRVFCRELTEQIVLDRKNRRQGLQKWVGQYAAHLEHMALRFPLQWFNFYSFWADEA